MRLIKDNVERIVESKETADQLMKKGWSEVKDSTKKKVKAQPKESEDVIENDKG